MEHNRNRKKPTMPEEKTVNQTNQPAGDPGYDSYPDISNVASASECTGLMYAPPQSQDEFGSYQELSGMELPKEKES